MVRVPRIPVRSVTFAEALEQTEGRRRHLLLGNGFSIAAHQAFSYESLLGAAGDLDEHLAGVFQELDTTDFEVTLKFLSDSLAVLKLYEADRRLLRRIERDIVALKAHLVASIARVHPATSISLDEDQYAACVEFLELFTGPGLDKRGRVFTTNYDLLIYWVMVRNRDALRCDDGFRRDGWSVNNIDGQSFFFMHGGLHIFEDGRDIRKLVFRNRPLIDQIQERMNDNQLPLFVSEGTSAQKLARIRENEYLNAARTAFRRACKRRPHVLFTVGHGLRAQDAHITDIIGRGRVSDVYIGAYGGLNSRDGLRARHLAQEWATMRSEQEPPAPMSVYVFDTAQCPIWAAQDEEVQ